MNSRSKRQCAQSKCRDVETLLNSWLAERQLLLSLYCELSTVVKNTTNEAVMQKIDRFCEVLVDYVCAGHFEVYCELFDVGRSRAIRRHPRISALYAQIMSTTAIALDFNDRYLNGRQQPALVEHFSVLGQMLAIRFDSEDDLIRELYRPSRAAA